VLVQVVSGFVSCCHPSLNREKRKTRLRAPRCKSWNENVLNAKRQRERINRAKKGVGWVMG
jgi:hypothetical protein